MKKTILAISIFLLGWAAPLPAEVITYQGRLKEASLPVNDNRSFLFEFCDDESAGACTASPSGAQPFAVQNGLFKSTFTAPTVGLASGQWYLKVSVGGVALTPRERLTAVPYSVYAATAAYSPQAVQKTGDTMSGQLTLSGSTLTVTGSEFSVGGSTFVVKNGYVGIGTASPGYMLHVSSAAGVAGNMVVVSTGGSDVIRLTGAGEVFASRFVGDGSGITGVTGATGTDPNALPLAGGTMSGSINLGANGLYSVSSVTASGDITAARYQVLGATVIAISGTGSFSAGVGAGAVNSGDFDTFVGYYAGSANTSGTYNSFVGFNAGNANTSGSFNAFGGAYAGPLNTTGSSNSVFGYGALANSLVGSANSVLGMQAGRGFVGASFSSATLVGYRSGYNLTTGSDNTFLGWQAGYGVTTGNGNIVIGYAQDASSPGANSQLNIGGVLFGDLDLKSIGISTRAPEAALDVVGSPARSVALFRSTGVTTVSLQSDDAAAQKVSLSFNSWSASQSGLRHMSDLNSEANGDMTINTTNAGASSGIERLRITAAGRMGVSYTSPEARLDVLADSPGPGTMVQLWRDPTGTIVSSVSATGQFQAVRFIGDGSGLTNVAATTGVDATKVAKAGDTMTGQLTLAASTLTVTGDAFSVGGSSLVVAAGKVGIGAEVPQAKLHISSGGMIIDGDVAGVMLHVKAPPSGTTTRISLEGSDSNSFQAYELKQPSRTWWIAQNLGNFSDGRLQIFDASASNYRAVFFATGDIGLGGIDAQTAPVLMVKPTGLVGLGGNSPGAALDVRTPAATELSQIWRDSAGTVVSSVSAAGVIQAIQFVGDGSGLTNVAAATGVDATKLPLAGGVMQGTLDMGGNYLAGVSTITMYADSIAIVPPGTGGNNGGYGVSIGSNSFDNYSYGVGVGMDTYNNHSGVGVGYFAHNNYQGLGIGYNAQGNYSAGVGVGPDTTMNSISGVGVGSRATSNSNYGLGLGAEASYNRNYGVGVGAYASDNGDYAVGVGAYSRNTAGYGAALGAYSYASSSATALGAQAKANAELSLALGYGTVNNSTGTASFGNYAVYTASNIVIGSAAQQARLDVQAAADRMAQVWRDPAGVIVSSVNPAGYLQAVKFIGDGSGLTNVAAATGLDASKLPLAGGTMSGQLTLAGSSLTMQTAGVVNFAVDAAGHVGINGYPDAAAGLRLSGTNLFEAGLQLDNGGSIWSIINDATILKFVKSDGATYVPLQLTAAGAMSLTGSLYVAGDLSPAFRVGGSTLVVNGGMVGINTATPSSALDIGAGNIRVLPGQSLEWGSAANAISASGTGMSLFENGVPRLHVGSTGGAGTVALGDYAAVTIDTTAAVHVVAEGAPGSDGRVAVFGDLRSNGSVSGQYLAAGNFETTIAGADSADLAAGLRAVIRHENAGVGVVKKAYGLIVDDLQNSAGTIDTTYGVYIGTQTAGSQVNPPYSLYAADQNAWNYFGGRVGIGTESPQDTLHLAGTNPWLRIKDADGSKAVSIGMANNVLRFDEAGVGARMVLDLDTSRVGINTLSPNYTLDVQGGNINASGGLCINDTCVSDWGSAGVWTRTGVVVSPSNASNNVLIQSTLTVAGGAFSVGGSALAVGDGMVGIGTNEPAHALHISSGDASGWNPNVLIESTASGTPQLILQAGGHQGRIATSGSNGGTYIGSLSNDFVSFQSNSIERMRLSNDGKIGMGTASPASALDVFGRVQISTRTLNNDLVDGLLSLGSGGMAFQSAGTTFMRVAYGGNYIGIGAGVNSTTNAPRLQVQGSMSVGSGVASSQPPANSLVVEGKVGIGTVAPSGLLEVRDIAATNGYLLVLATGTGGSFFSVSTAGVVGVGYGNPSTSTVLHAQAVATNLTAGEDVAAGLIGSARAIGTGPEDVAVGGDFRAEADGNQNLAFLAGLHANVERTSAGTGVIANAVGLYIDMPRNGSSPGGFTDTYGIYIATQTSGNQTNLPYAVYSEDQNARAYFAGKMGLGTASPRYALEISSAAGSSDQMLVVSTGTDIVFGVKGNGEVYGARFIGDGSGLVNVVMNGGTMSQPLVINADTAVYPSNLVTDGLVISTSGALQTAGMGNGGIVGNARGIGAVDLQTSRVTNTEVASGGYSVVGGGKGNKATVAFAVASGGNNNIASGGYSVVGGGNANQSSNGWTTVGGGSGNIASQNNATVAGGSANIASGSASAISGGYANKAYAAMSSIGGGEYNIVSGSDSAISGGSYNTVVGTSAVVAGGYNNKAGGLYSFIGGGSGNTALDYSLVAGGASNSAMGYYTAIGGGRGNYGAYFATIGGGSNNRVDGYFAVVSGGENNLSTAPYSVVGGGLFNTSSGTYSGVLAGHMNETLGTAAAVVGGRGNRATGDDAFIGGGSGNIAFDPGTAVVGGLENAANESFSFVGGGKQNTAATGYSAIAGGYINIAGTVGGDGAYSFIGAGYSNETQTDYTVIGGGIDNYITNSGMYSVIGGGGGNTISAQYAAVVGGLNNSAKGQYSFVGGGGPNATVTGNEAAGDFSAVVGGSSNTVTAQLGFVGGGDDNHVYGDRGVAVGGARNTAGVAGTKFHAAVVGGQDNRAIGEGSFVGGGAANTAFGNYSVVPGGHSNWAGGSNSFAAGYTSTAAADGSFAWNDASVDSLVNTYMNQVQFRATGGFWVSTGTIHATPGLFVNMANWVGMGTDAPTKMLHIKNQGVVPDIRLERGLGGETWDIGGNSGVYFNIASGGNNRLTITDTGFVSIGVTPTSSKLQVNGDLGLGDGTPTGNAPIIIRLTAAAAVLDGDIVVASGGNQFSTTITGSDYRAIGVAVGATPGGNIGKVAVGGVVLVNCAAGPTAGQHAITSGTAGLASGVNNPTSGTSVGQFLTGCGTPAAGKAYLLLR